MIVLGKRRVGFGPPLAVITVKETLYLRRRRVKEIKLTQGKVTLVDDWEYERLNKYKWCAHLNGNTYYAVKGVPIIRMHHSVLPPPPGLEIDHIDGDGLNNQRHNLRYCEHQQNCMNRRIQSGTSSKYKGVSWDKRKCKWQASIALNHKTSFLGYFKTEKEAALIYNVAAIQRFGEFARLNITNVPVDREQLMEKLIRLEKGGDYERD